MINFIRKLFIPTRHFRVDDEITFSNSLKGKVIKRINKKNCYLIEINSEKRYSKIITLSSNYFYYSCKNKKYKTFKHIIL